MPSNLIDLTSEEINPDPSCSSGLSPLDRMQPHGSWRADAGEKEQMSERDNNGQRATARISFFTNSWMNYHDPDAHARSLLNHHLSRVSILRSDALQLSAVVASHLTLMRAYYARQEEAELISEGDCLSALRIELASERAATGAEVGQLREMEAKELELDAKLTRMRSDITERQRHHEGRLACLLQLRSSLAPNSSAEAGSAPLLTSVALSRCAPLSSIHLRSFALSNICATAELLAETFDALENGDRKAEWHQHDPIREKMRRLMTESAKAIECFAKLSTPEGAAQQGVVRAMLRLGVYGTLGRQLLTTGRVSELNASSNGELTALQLATMYDAALDRRCLLRFLRNGLDPSDASLAYPERRSAISVARETVRSNEEAQIMVSSDPEQWVSAPQSLLMMRAESRPLSGERRLHVGRRCRLRFCVELLAAWQAHSQRVRQALTEAAPQLQVDSGAIIELVSQYLDLEPPRDGQEDNTPAPTAASGLQQQQQAQASTKNEENGESAVASVEQKLAEKDVDDLGLKLLPPISSDAMVRVRSDEIVGEPGQPEARNGTPDPAIRALQCELAELNAEIAEIEQSELVSVQMDGTQLPQTVAEQTDAAAEAARAEQKQQQQTQQKQGSDGATAVILPTYFSVARGSELDALAERVGRANSGERDAATALQLLTEGDDAVAAGGRLSRSSTSTSADAASLHTARALSDESDTLTGAAGDDERSSSPVARLRAWHEQQAADQLSFLSGQQEQTRHGELDGGRWFSDDLSELQLSDDTDDLLHHLD